MKTRDNTNMIENNSKTLNNKFWDGLQPLLKIYRINIANSECSPSIHSSSKRHIKWPAIKLPTFSGNVTEFRHFRDTFTSLVINNYLLDNIQEHYYLLSSVLGEAHKITEGSPITANNFEAYHNPELTVTTHVKYCLYQLLSCIQHRFKKFGEPVLLPQLVLDKLYEQSCNKWEVGSSSNQNLFEFLEIRCQALELIKHSKLPVASNSVYETQDTITKPIKTVTQAYAPIDGSCMKCYEIHALHRCPQFLNGNFQASTGFMSRNIVRQCTSGSC
ncbi:hypothetical protein PR048_025446 [Dryococelus australis]|uniref:Uncharacterized protein n=1 Tax=Dryococelus australis TaxID=614101 RepID=A0ABQ9GRC7_9NEOP|nr:hypothetical protein PR048_025446 [Dryococelus australis]